MPVILLQEPKVSHNATALWCVLVQATFQQRSVEVTTRSRGRLLQDLGLQDHDERTVTRATAALSQTGWLVVERRRVGDRTRNVYRPLQLPQPGDGESYVEVPHHALALMRDGTITPEQLRALACWLDACGSQGWTRDTLARHAEAYGSPVRSARRYRAALVQAGLLELQRCPGRTSVTSRPGRGPTPATDGTSLASGKSPDRGHHRHITTATDCTSPRPQMTPCSTTSRKKNLPKEEPAGVLSRRDLPSRTANASEAPPAASKGKTGSTRATTQPGARQHPDAGPVLAAVLDVLAPMPVWVRLPVLARLTQALDDGYGPAALVRAVEEHFGREASGEGRHLAELERTLGYLRGDVLAGGCASCGQNPHEDFGREVCLTCHPERTDEVDPDALQRVLASLQGPPTALAVRQC